MTRLRPVRAGLRLLPLVLWMGWAAPESAEAPASGATTDGSGPAAAPLQATALPSAPSLRVAGSRGPAPLPVGPAGPDHPIAASAALHRAGAVLDPGLRRSLPPDLSLLEQVSNRIRGPPAPVG